MIPEAIQELQVLQAIQKIDTEGIPYPLTQSKKYDLVYKAKTYPPKLVISMASEFAIGEYWTHKKFNTYEAQKYLKELSPDFKIEEKGPNIIENLIEEYKKRIKKKGFIEELYKWKLIEKLKGRPDVGAKDFTTEIKEVNPQENNMVYQMAKATSNRMAKYKPEEYRACFKELYDEKLDLDKRIKGFMNQTIDIYKVAGGEKSAHHDERTTSAYLTFANPEKYTFYKSSYYNEYCLLTGIKPKPTGEKYIHYLELIHDLIDNYILEDVELLDTVDAEIQKGDCYPDKNRLLLAQDILYQMLEAPITKILVNITWNSNDWKGVSEDKSAHK